MSKILAILVLIFESRLKKGWWCGYAGFSYRFRLLHPITICTVKTKQAADLEMECWQWRRQRGHVHCDFDAILADYGPRTTDWQWLKQHQPIGWRSENVSIKSTRTGSYTDRGCMQDYRTAFTKKGWRRQSVQLDWHTARRKRPLEDLWWWPVLLPQK